MFPGYPRFWGGHADAAGGQSTPQCTNNVDASVTDATEDDAPGVSGSQNTVPPLDKDIEPLGGVGVQILDFTTSLHIRIAMLRQQE